MRGSNVYAILRTQRAQSTESIVLASPYQAEDNIHGAAIMLALAKYFKGDLHAVNHFAVQV